MGAISRKNFANPDDVIEVPNAKMELLNLGEAQVFRFIFEPGWRYSESMKRVDGTEICPAPHSLVTISGRLAVQTDDGEMDEFGPGDIGFIPPGHDAWVVGDEPFIAVDFQNNAIHEQLSA
jgi:hypothetical protein